MARLRHFFLLVLLTGAVNILAATTAVSAGDQTQHLVFLTWAEYLDPAVLDEFKQRFNAKVKFVYYESDDVRSELLLATDGKGYDVVLTSGLDLQKYVKRGWLAPIDRAMLPNAQHITARWIDAFPAAQTHAIPYFWGTLGIAYRQDLAPGPLTTWRQLLNPPEELRGKIIMNRYSRELTAVALKALGYSLNSDDLSQLNEAEQLLQAQLPYVQDYTYVSLNDQSALVTGDVWVSMMYSGDALMVQEYHDEIVYVTPEEGSNLWVDYLAIAQSSAKKQLAAAFINFLNEPAIAARNAEYVYYATPNKAAEVYLPDEYFENPVIYPNDDYLARSEFYQPLSPRAQKLTNGITARLLNRHASRQ